MDSFEKWFMICKTIILMLQQTGMWALLNIRGARAIIFSVYRQERP